MYILDNHNNMHQLTSLTRAVGSLSHPCTMFHYTLQRGSYSLLSLYNFDIILYLEKSTATIYMYILDGHYEIHWLTHEGTSIPIPLIVPFGEYLGDGRDHILMVFLWFCLGFYALLENFSLT